MDININIDHLDDLVCNLNDEDNNSGNDWFISDIEEYYKADKKLQEILGKKYSEIDHERAIMFSLIRRGSFEVGFRTAVALIKLLTK